MLVIALSLHFYPESIFFYPQILYRENTFVASVNFFGESLRFCGTFAIINTNPRQSEVSCMKKHPLLTAAAAAGTAVLGAAYGIYRVAFYQKPTTAVPSPADMPTREVYRKAMCPDADALARDTFTPVHITAQDGTPLAARYYHHNDGAPLAIIFHGYRGYAVRDGLGGYTLCTKLGYNVLLPDQRAHGYSGGHTITMGVKERYDARDWAVWARSHFGPEVPIFLMGVSMGAATVLLAAGLNLPDNVCGIVADCGYTSPREITRKCLPEYLPGFPLGPTYAIGRLGAILFGHFDPEDADCTDAAAHSKVPIFFVHGDADGFVPYEMGRRNYEVCRAKLHPGPRAAAGRDRDARRVHRGQHPGCGYPHRAAEGDRRGHRQRHLGHRVHHLPEVRLSQLDPPGQRLRLRHLRQRDDHRRRPQGCEGLCRQRCDRRCRAQGFCARDPLRHRRRGTGRR